MAPKIIGRYQVNGTLGYGGMAVVYLATDPYVNRQVAIKLLPAQFNADRQLKTLFQREAELIASLEHPYIVPIYDFGEFEDRPYIVMRYLSGGSLQERLQIGPLPPHDALSIVQRVAQALAAAHEKGIVHRDLKPGNILFDDQNQAFLSDFGIAKVLEASLSYTNSGIIGTPAYMSPEQASGTALDSRSDIYAFGAVLFYMLVGKPPYEADTPVALALKHITDPVPNILALKPDLPPDYELFINRAMAKDRTQRFETSLDFAQALEAIFVGKPLPFDPNTLDKASEATGKLAPAGQVLPTKQNAAQSAKTTQDEKRQALWLWGLLPGLLLLLLAFYGINRFILNPASPTANIQQATTAAALADEAASQTSMPASTNTPASTATPRFYIDLTTQPRG